MKLFQAPGLKSKLVQTVLPWPKGWASLQVPQPLPRAILKT